MKNGTTSAAVLGLVGGMALGVWVGAEMTSGRTVAEVPVAVEGFKDAEQFATIAHAARNTQVPFILLKHRVLAEGQSLEEAIVASKPDLDAATEVALARREAKADVAALSGNTATDE